MMKGSGALLQLQTRPEGMFGNAVQNALPTHAAVPTHHRVFRSKDAQSGSKRIWIRVRVFRYCIIWPYNGTP
jgi:hypothetical protein